MNNALASYRKLQSKCARQGAELRRLRAENQALRDDLADIKSQRDTLAAAARALSAPQPEPWGGSNPGPGF